MNSKYEDIIQLVKVYDDGGFCCWRVICEFSDSVALSSSLSPGNIWTGRCPVGSGAIIIVSMLASGMQAFSFLATLMLRNRSFSIGKVSLDWRNLNTAVRAAVERRQTRDVKRACYHFNT